jgi:hypothetical protein
LNLHYACVMSRAFAISPLLEITAYWRISSCIGNLKLKLLNTIDILLLYKIIIFKKNIHVSVVLTADIAYVLVMMI